MSTQLENLLRNAVDTTRPYRAAPKDATVKVHEFLYKRLLPGLLAVNPASNALSTNAFATSHKLGFPSQWRAGEEGYFDSLATLKHEADELFVARLQSYQAELKKWSQKNREILVEQGKEFPSAKRLVVLEDELVPLTVLKDAAFEEFFFARCLEETVRVIPSSYGVRDAAGIFTSTLSVENTVSAIKRLLRVTVYLPKDHPGRFVRNWTGEFSKLTQELFGA